MDSSRIIFLQLDFFEKKTHLNLNTKYKHKMQTEKHKKQTDKHKMQTNKKMDPNNAT